MGHTRPCTTIPKRWSSDLLDYHHAGHRTENTGILLTVAYSVLQKVGRITSVMNDDPTNCVLFDNNYLITIMLYGTTTRARL